MAESKDEAAEVRITDPYTVRMVIDEQNRTGEKSLAKVAGRLISERLAIRENAPAQPMAETAA